MPDDKTKPKKPRKKPAEAKKPQPGRTAGGQFAKGNQAAKGNPYTRKAAEMRKALYSAVTADDIRQIVETLKAQAMRGDLKAIAILFDRVLGTAQAGIDLMERIEQLQATIEAIEEATNTDTERKGRGFDAEPGTDYTQP